MKGPNRRRNYFASACALTWFAFFAQSAGAELLLFDDFDYVVPRNPTTLPGNLANQFATTGPWTSAKAVNITGSHQGYLYTVTATEMASTTGYSGTLPNPSSRILKMEHPAGTTQSDFYLEYAGGDNAIPANVWFQWWMYLNHSGSERGGYTAGKFLYPSNDGYGSNSNKWLMTMSSWAAAPQFGGNPYGNPTSGGMFLSDFGEKRGSTADYSPVGDWDQFKLGPNLLPRSESYLHPNQWWQIKVHYDFSVANRGTFEMWIRPLGGSWRKIAEWIGGVTPNFTWGGFTPGGHRSLRMPTTILDAGASPSLNPGSFIYMQDFAMATDEASLPGDGFVRPRSPSDVIAE